MYCYSALKYRYMSWKFLMLNSFVCSGFFFFCFLSFSSKLQTLTHTCIHRFFDLITKKKREKNFKVKEIKDIWSICFKSFPNSHSSSLPPLSFSFLANSYDSFFFFLTKFLAFIYIYICTYIHMNI